MSDLEEKQQTEISDIIEDFMPATEPPAEPVAPVETPAVETKPNEEGTVNVEEGKERQAEAASGQEQTGEPPKEGEAQVTPPVKPVASVVPPVVPPVEPPKQETDLERMTRENAELKAHLEEMAGKFVTPPAPKQLTPEEQAAQKTQREQQAKQILKFLPDDTVFDDVMKSSENFNALLTSVVNTAVERSLRLMPQVATQLVEQQINLKTAVRDFYTDNKDLEPHKKYVGFVANEVAAQHSDWGLTQILQETEKEVRNRLKLARAGENMQAVQPGSVQQTGTIINRTAPSNPGFVPGGGGGRRGSSTGDGNLSSQEKDIINLIS